MHLPESAQKVTTMPVSRGILSAGDSGLYGELTWAEEEEEPKEGAVRISLYIWGNEIIISRKRTRERNIISKERNKNNEKNYVPLGAPKFNVVMEFTELNGEKF